MGIQELQKSVDTLIVIPNQNLFRIANDKTTFADAFAMADQVLYSGVACITDLMVKEGLINLDFADVRSVMREMGRAMMGTGEASGEGRAMQAAEAAIANPLLDETSMKGAQGLLISITGGRDLTLFEVDEAATRIREEVDPDANIILGATFDESLEGIIRVSVVATGIDRALNEAAAKNMEFRQVAKPLIRPSAAAAPAAGRSAACLRSAGTEGRRSDRADHPHGGSRDGTRTGNPGRARSRSCRRRKKPSVRRAGSSRPLLRLPSCASRLLRPRSCSSRWRSLRSASLRSRCVRSRSFARPPSRSACRRSRISRRSFRLRSIIVPSPPAQPSEERGPMGLLKRITNSLGRREEDSVSADMTAAAPSAASQQRRPLSPEASLYAPRRGQLDDQGRAVPQARMTNEDDQLEIPAFLRRQSN